MRIRLFRIAALIALLAVSFTVPISAVRAQDDTSGDSPEILMQAHLGPDELPTAPAFVRLLVINLDPGAGSPLHTHPGPEIGVLQTGSLTVKVNGKATITDVSGGEGTPVPPADAPMNSEIQMQAGDQIYYLMQTPMTFTNTGDDVASILTAVVLPAGHQHPPGITYLEGEPDESAFEGVVPEILGDGIATSLPADGGTLTVERVTFGPGEAIPASDSVTMYSLEQGPLEFAVIGGKVQVSRAASPGPQSDSAPGTQVSMAKGDAIFFPNGNEEISREGIDSSLTVLRLTIVPDSATATPEAGGIGQIQVVTSVATPEVPAATPEAEASPAASPEAEASPEVQYPVGTIIQTTEDGIRVRSGPSTDDEIVITLDNAGALMRVTGPPEEGSGILWWPVEWLDDTSVTGYVSDDYVTEAEQQQST